MDENDIRSLNHQRDWALTERHTPPERPVAERLGDFAEVEGDFDEAAAIEQASRCIQCAMPFCVAGCPVGSDIPGWLLLVADGKFLEAAAVSRLANNLPDICARLCPGEETCEARCALGDRTDPIPIRTIEKFIHEYAGQHQGERLARARPNGCGVAVVGTGLAALACADDLARQGYTVTVFESQFEGDGGWFAQIMPFRLAPPVVERRLAILQHHGVTLNKEIVVGRHADLCDLTERFDAVFLAMSVHQPKVIHLPGVELAGVTLAASVLNQFRSRENRRVNTGLAKDRRVVVLGGGDTAVDCLRTALRCGARSATGIYRRDAPQLPAGRHALDLALTEGVRFVFLGNPIEFIGAGGHVTRVRCQRTVLGEPDGDGRPQPRAVPDSEFEVPADLAVIAFGYEPMRFPPASDWARLQANDRGTVMVDQRHMTSVSRVFAGGDLVLGPSPALVLVKDGRTAASAIHQFLGGKAGLHPGVDP